MNKQTVLIVDDDEIIRKQLEKELKRNFITTFLSGDGKTALKIMAQEKIDILLLDVNLPDINGLELLEQVKSENPHCEVIVVTGFGTQEIAIQSLRRGAIDYIEKPVNMEELYTALGRAQEKIAEKEELSYKNTLLVIDDEQEIAHRLKKFLTKEGYEVFEAYNGKEGLDIIEHNKIDVLITDIKMDDMDGIEVLRRAKVLYRDIEGIVVTGYKEQELAIKSLRAGAIDYITKPINLDELLISVEEAIERINLSRNRLYRSRELKISSEIISKMNEELERRIEERSRKLSQTQAQLFQTAKLATLGEMSTGLAHEINQPLGGIQLITTNIRKLIERGMLTDEELLSCMKDIDFSVNRMSKVIRHIRTFARQDTMKFIEVLINDTIASGMSLLGEQMRLHEIEVVQELAPDLPKVIGEPYQLEQVWINLISNARDAMDENEKRIANAPDRQREYHKKLVISTAYDESRKEVDVIFTDNGLGMSALTREKLFEPFFTTKEVGKSTGLGLSISYGIIENHKGRFEVQSEEEKGTTMRVALPAQVEEES